LNLENDHKNDPEVGATGTQSQYNDPEVTKVTTETDPKLTIQANVEANLEITTIKMIQKLVLLALRANIMTRK
jgi:hypothetical protein